MSFENRLKALLKFKGLQQKELAKKVGASEALVSRWCKGVLTPKLRHVKKIADIFNIPVDLLVGNCQLFDELLDKVDVMLI